MYIKSILQNFKSECISELKKKEADLIRLKNSIDNLIEQSRKEILKESERLDKEKRNIAKERDRIERDKQDLEIKRTKTEDLITKQKARAEREIKSERDKMVERIDRHIEGVIDFFDELATYGQSPKLVDAYINACFILDGKLAQYFEKCKRPNVTAAGVIREYQKKNKEYLQRIMEQEYLLSELWAVDTDTSEKEQFEYLDDDEDRIKVFLSSSDLSLSETERNQKALENYLHKKHSKSHIGKMYERYVGYLYEKDGYSVEYRGIKMGLKDGGIDLICRKRGEILLVQCKNWKQESIIYEKHICQLYGASRFYDKDYIQEEFCDTLFAETEWERVTPVFVTTTQLDEHAKEVANKLGVIIRYIPFDKRYPIIKCNIKEGHKIYHLPIDQMYDLTKICNRGEFYASTVQEAVDAGFRRAKRHNMQNQHNYIY